MKRFSDYYKLCLIKGAWITIIVMTLVTFAVGTIFCRGEIVMKTREHVIEKKQDLETDLIGRYILNRMQDCDTSNYKTYSALDMLTFFLTIEMLAFFLICFIGNRELDRLDRMEELEQNYDNNL